jgi:hypothetical protein
MGRNKLGAKKKEACIKGNDVMLQIKINKTLIEFNLN